MKIIERIHNRLPQMVFFGILFAVMGQFITSLPDVYFKYLDKTDYYHLEVPMEIESSEYEPCSQVKAYANRDSLINSEASVIRELVLIEDSGEVEEVFYDNAKIAINEGKEKVSFFFWLPCDTNDGEYFYRGTITFPVYGIDRSYPFYTDTFKVRN